MNNLTFNLDPMIIQVQNHDKNKNAMFYLGLHRISGLFYIRLDIRVRLPARKELFVEIRVK